MKSGFRFLNDILKPVSFFCMTIKFNSVLGAIQCYDCRALPLSNVLEYSCTRSPEYRVVDIGGNRESCPGPENFERAQQDKQLEF